MTYTLNTFLLQLTTSIAHKYLPIRFQINNYDVLYVSMVYIRQSSTIFQLSFVFALGFKDNFKITKQKHFVTYEKENQIL